MSIYK